MKRHVLVFIILQLAVDVSCISAGGRNIYGEAGVKNSKEEVAKLLRSYSVRGKRSNDPNQRRSSTNSMPKMTTTEYDNVRVHCVQKVQKDLKETPIQNIDVKKERKWISNADKGKKRWQSYYRCLVGSNPAIKYFADDKCKEKEHDTFVIDGEYDKCVQKGWKEVVAPTMFPDMTFDQMENMRRKCMRKVIKKLGKEAVEPIPAMDAKDEVWFRWFSVDVKRWETYEPCLEDQIPAIKYCLKDVCGEIQIPENFTTEGPFDKCIEDCWEKIQKEEKKD